MNYLVMAIAVMVVSLAAMLACSSCGGGSITFTPGTGNNNPPQSTKSPSVDVGKIYAGADMFIPQMVIRGQAGAAEPGATLHYISHTGVSTSGPAGADGSFEISNFPFNFDIGSGAGITITQTAPGMTESDPVSIQFN
jgi:hypothetical protein